jgi:hypothetical protein
MWSATAITKRNILLCDNDYFENAKVIDKGTKITITKGIDEKYALWSHHGIYNLNEWYIDESTLKIISNN